jgi:hypothetical protein
MSRIIAVTPAGRRRYLELLNHYITQDETIDEWQLWDNCRAESDRAYVHQLSKRNSKIHVVQYNGAGGDGSNRSINNFYRGLKDPNAFYIKMDDDLVYLPSNFGASLHKASRLNRNRYLWWSPLVINNALCSWILKYHSGLEIDAPLSAQAADQTGWASPYFAECLHLVFLNSIRDRRLSFFQVPSFEISLCRFSINCIGFYGSDVISLGDDFCPIGVDDEEWLSAVLPSRLERAGRVEGNLIVSHFSYYIQESHLLKSDVLAQYYEIAGLVPHKTAEPVGWKGQLKQRIKQLLLIRPLRGRLSKPVQQKHYRISLNELRATRQEISDETGLHRREATWVSSSLLGDLAEG